eukprot:NODE_1698_length_1089_cov_75.094231_g1383_i0.p1 GENE.NODE_1698_length_1089_cov_75.094231_g1383_i0~~NODE_1698_length_1089_cov_75.094231_g1383_i0.p1  ORF type:complete len:201 (+),score=40.49 NODE_1698_length_1089_cov_75.094231_g1383_i0:302-904(+)
MMHLEGRLTWNDNDIGLIPAFSDAYKLVEQTIARLMVRYGEGVNKIYLSGHSLGGALSQIGAAHISTNFPQLSPKLRVITLASPRVGNDRFAMRYKMEVPESLRFINIKDPVAYLPPQSLGLEHTHNKIAYDNGKKKWIYEYHGRFIPDVKYHKVGPLQVNSETCRDYSNGYTCCMRYLPRDFSGFEFSLPDSFECLKDA